MIYFKIVLVIIILLINGCSHKYKVTKREWNDKNPTSYVFDMELHKLRKKIKHIFTYDYQYSHQIPLDYTKTYDYGEHTRMHIDDIKDISEGYRHKIIKSNNHYDFILNGLAETFYSDLYIVRDKKAIALAYFQIHFTKISKNKTKVTIIAYIYQVHNGTHFTAHGDAYSFKDMKPTTIEEYIILKYIGKALGYKMPKVKKP